MNRISENRDLGRKKSSRRYAAVASLAAPVIALIVASSLTFDSQRAKAQPSDPSLARIAADGAGRQHKEDPCERLPEARGRAEGHDRKCRGGSSSGVSRGDFNGDGFADLAVGAPGKNSPATVANSGAVFVIYGSATGLLPEGGNGIPATQFWSQNAEGVPDTSEAGDGFGSALAAGEFNGDEFSDLAIGVDGEDVTLEGLFFGDVGRVVVIYGSPNGLTATDPAVPAAQSLELTDFLFIEGHSGDESMGSALTWGDFNGDEVGDLAVGAPGVSFFAGDSFRSNAGAVLIYFGTEGAGLATVGGQILHQSTPGIADAAADNDHFGEVLTAADFNADGRADLVVAAPDEDFLEVRDVGVVHVIFGGENGLTGDNDRLFSLDDFRNDVGFIGLPAADDEFGTSLAAGDFNRDGRADLAIGAPERSVGATDGAGLVFIISSSGTGVLNARRLFQQNDLFANGSESFDRFGEALAAGDFNADGAADLAIGVPFEDLIGANGQTIRNGGEVNVVYGSSSGLVIAIGTAQQFRQGAGGVLGTLEEDDRFGNSLSAWNFGRNLILRDVTVRTADLAIGVPLEDFVNLDGSVIRDGGAINVLYGGLGGLTSNNDQLLFQSNIGGFTNVAGDRFGRFLY